MEWGGVWWGEVRGGMLFVTQVAMSVSECVYVFAFACMRARAPNLI